jgi:hypothetical protein
MLTPNNLARIKPGLKGEDTKLNAFLNRTYDHDTQTRTVGLSGLREEMYPTSTRFDGDKT